MVYIPPTMTVSGTAGSTGLGYAATLASTFNKTNQAAANQYNTGNYRPPGQKVASSNVNRTNPEAGGAYQDYLGRVSGGETDLPDWISRRNPFPMGGPEMRSKYPNTTWGEFQYKQDLAKMQNLNLAQQRIDKTSMAQAQQLGETRNYEAANRADIGYELQNQFRNDMANINTRGFGGLVGKEFGLAGGPALGRLAEGASMASYHRANKMTEFNAEMAKMRGDVFKWGGDQQRQNLSDINIEYPPMDQYIEMMKAPVGGQAYGSGSQSGAGGNTGAGFNLIGGQNTVLGQALMGGRGGGQRRDPFLAAKQQMNRQLQAAWDKGDMWNVKRLKKIGEDLGWTWGGGSGQG